MTSLRTGVAIVVIWGCVVIAYVLMLSLGYGDVGLQVSCGFIVTTAEHGRVFIGVTAILFLMDAIVIRVVCMQQKRSDSIEMLELEKASATQCGQVSVKLKQEAKTAEGVWQCSCC